MLPGMFTIEDLIPQHLKDASSRVPMWQIQNVTHCDPTKTFNALFWVFFFCFFAEQVYKAKLLISSCTFSIFAFVDKNPLF